MPVTRPRLEPSFDLFGRCRSRLARLCNQSGQILARVESVDDVEHSLVRDHCGRQIPATSHWTRGAPAMNGHQALDRVDAFPPWDINLDGKTLHPHAPHLQGRFTSQRGFLAAVQVGVAKRLLVIDLQEKDEETGTTIRTPRVFINPEFTPIGDALSVYNEGCLSVPDQYGDVERPASIRAKWLDSDGKAHDEQLDGMIATCLQHEMDHLEGILFFDHLSKLKRDMLLKKLAKQRKLAA